MSKLPSVSGEQVVSALGRIGVRPHFPVAFMISREACRREFEPDGALRDIYILDTRIGHWRKLFMELRFSLGVFS